MAVTFDATKKEIYISDIGVTMRTLLAVAAAGYADSQVRRWHVVYKKARIGLVQVKTESSKGNENGRHADSAKISTDKDTSKPKTIKRKNLALAQGQP